MAGEEDYIGPHLFQNGHKVFSANMNRFLLLEFCATSSLRIANTFFEQSSSEKVTYRELATKSMDPISPTTFAQLDYFLVEQRWAHKVTDIASQRCLALPTHHFLVLCRLDVTIEKQPRRKAATRGDVSELNNFQTATSFSKRVVEITRGQLQHAGADGISADQFNDPMTRALRQASDEQLPVTTTAPKHPWVSPQTLVLVEQRLQARQQGDYEEEKRVSRMVKRNVKN